MTPEELEQANCRGVDPEIFFPVQGDPGKAAKAICRNCVIREVCLEENIGEHGGVYGGLNDKERRRLRAGRVGLTLVEPDLLQ